MDICRRELYMAKFDFLSSWHAPVVWFIGSFIQHIASEHHCVGLEILVAHSVSSAEFKWDIIGLQLTGGEHVSIFVTTCSDEFTIKHSYE